MSSAFTYLIQGEDGGPVKIGVTRTSLQRRLDALQGGSPVRLRLIAALSGDHEKKLHQAFGDRRIRGEWFDVSAKEIVEYIEPELDPAQDRETRFLMVALLAVDD